MIRSPAASSLALIAPVRLRRVASGLIIENVRSTAISAPSSSFREGERLYSHPSAMRQAP
jgi:hypothetical protein